MTIGSELSRFGWAVRWHQFLRPPDVRPNEHSTFGARAVTGAGEGRKQRGGRAGAGAGARARAGAGAGAGARDQRGERPRQGQQALQEKTPMVLLVQVQRLNNQVLYPKHFHPNGFVRVLQQQAHVRRTAGESMISARSTCTSGAASGPRGGEQEQGQEQEEQE